MTVKHDIAGRKTVYMLSLNCSQDGVNFTNLKCQGRDIMYELTLIKLLPRNGVLLFFNCIVPGITYYILEFVS